jgi:hypothetical protein
VALVRARPRAVGCRRAARSSPPRRSCFLRGLRLDDAATTGIVVWTAMLAIYAVALTRAPARGAAIGAAAAAAWLAATLARPRRADLQRPGPAGDRARARSARADASPASAPPRPRALLIAVLIDGPLASLLAVGGEQRAARLPAARPPNGSSTRSACGSWAAYWPPR